MTTFLRASFDFLLRFIPQTEDRYDIESQLTEQELNNYEPICDLDYIVIQIDTRDNIQYLASLV